MANTSTERQWTEARAVWLADARRSSEHTARSYETALRDFENFAHPLLLWQVGGREIAAWATDMAGRGLSDTTVNARLAALASFFRFCQRVYTDADGNGLIRHNPVDQVRRNRVNPYGHSRPLSGPEIRALLGAVDRRTIPGMRDYAMLLMAVFTGRRSAEIRNLRIGDMRHTADGTARFFWRGKGGKSGWADMPPPVHHAIRLYLEASGRLDAGAEECVFGQHNGQVFPGPRPLSSEWFNAMVKRYAAEAGLPEWVHTHTLRHTAANIRDRAGHDLMDISTMLSHASLRVTQVYLAAQRGFVDTGWQDVAQAIA